MKQGTHGSTKYPFKGGQVSVRVKIHDKIKIFGQTNSLVLKGLIPRFYHSFFSKISLCISCLSIVEVLYLDLLH